MLLQSNFVKEGERIDDLQYDGLKIIQNPSLYCFTSDAVLLANMVKANHKDVVCDLGTGSGIIATIVATKTNCKKVYGVELQAYMSDMASRSVKMNGLEDRIEIINSPMQNATEILGKESCSVVVCNPPYQKVGAGEKQLKEEIAISRHEVKVTLEEIVTSACNLLKYGGKFYIIHQAKRMAELIYLLEKHDLRVKKIIMIQPKANKNVDTVIVEATKNGKVGLIVPPPLVVFNDDGTPTSTVESIYRNDER